MAGLYFMLLWSLYAGVPQAAAQVDGSFWWVTKQKSAPPTQNTRIDPDGMINNSTDDEDATWCECVPWYQCNEDSIITDGSNLLDPRTKPVGPYNTDKKKKKPRTQLVRNVEICPNALNVCCGIPRDHVATVLPETPELPPGTPCNCVSYQECPRHLIVNDHQGETCLGVAGTTFSHSKCPHTLDVCCASDGTVASQLASYINDISNVGNCDCVEPHMCDNQGYIRSHNEDIPYEMNQREEPLSFNHNLCNNSGLVCCRPRVECECVDYNQCDEDGFIKTHGEGLLDFKTVGSQSETQGRCDDPCLICCKVREEVPTTTAIETLNTDSSEPPDECYCVEESQCNDEVEYHFGDYLIDPKINRCSSPEHICCKSPITPIKISNTDSSEPPDECYCVEESQCNDEVEYNYGEGFIDPKINKCSRPDHICCKSAITPTASPTIASIEPVIPQKDTCGTRNRKDVLNLRIMGFKDGQSQFGEFPWVVTVLRHELIVNIPTVLFIGGGTLIHPRVVLTAAHKIDSISSDSIVTRLGEWDTRSLKEPLPHQDIGVERVVIHPEFNKANLRHDVGLLFLKEDAAINGHIQKICLTNDISEVDPNNCVINGWGKQAFGNDAEYQVIMKSVTLPLVKSDKCQTQLRKTRLGRYFRLHNSFVCAGGEAGVDSCKGDGGGPLACPLRDNKNKYLLVGITAWGIGCGDEGVPGVYVDVPLHADWIRDQIEAVHPSTTIPPPIPTQSQEKMSINSEKQCMGKCKAVGSYCQGKVKPHGCADGEECCIRRAGGKPGMRIKVMKCRGECQAVGSACDGRVRPRGCADGEECCRRPQG